MEDNCWIDLNGNCLEEVPEGMYGFVYEIKVKPSYAVPNEMWYKTYVGKKTFTFRRKTKLSKKARVGTRKRIEIKQVDSNWKKYWGSSKELLGDIQLYGEENFERKILCFCRNKSELSYYELYWQIENRVLFENSYNGWISAKIYKKHLNV